MDRKKTRFAWPILALAALAALVMFVLPVPAAQGEGEPGQMNMDEMMKKWEEASTPGPAHRELDQMVGSWTTAVKMWVGGPDAPPQESKGTAEIRWVLDGRFLMEETSGEVMGKAHRGLGLTGYDNFKQTYVAVWMDNASTAIYTSQGTYDPGTKTWSSSGLMDEPTTGEKDKTVRYITRMVDANTMVTEIMDNAGGKEYKAVEITYTRKM